MLSGKHNAYSQTWVRLAECQLARTLGNSATAERFWAKVRRQEVGGGGCWLWLASVSGSKGYGQFGVSLPGAPGRGWPVYAHRAAWLLTHGEIPERLSVLHRCDVPRCCNPAHLFLGTHLDNMKDAARKGRLRVPRPNGRKVTDEQCDRIVARVLAGEQASVVAAECGVSKGFVSQVMSGKRRPDALQRARKQEAA